MPTAYPDNCDKQGCYHHDREHRRQRRLSLLYLHCANSVVPMAVSSNLNHPENREGNSATNTVSVSIISKQETIVLLLPGIKIGIEMMVVIFKWHQEVQGSRVQAENSLMTRGTGLPLSQLRSSELGGDFVLSHTPTQDQSLG